MNMITIDRVIVEQGLEALEYHVAPPSASTWRTTAAITAFRAVLAATQAEPVWNDPSTLPNDGEFLIGVWSGDWNNPCQRFTVFHAHGHPTGPVWSMKYNYRTEEGGAYKIAGWMRLPDKI